MDKEEVKIEKILEKKMTTAGAQFVFEAYDPKLTSWKRWVKRLETALTIVGSEESQKRNYLLHYMGARVYDTLCDKVLPKLPEEMTYKEITKILEEHFDPIPNEILENYRFHLRKQAEEESCTEYVVALKRMAASCNFGTYMEKALRNQFVFGLKNQLIQSRLLEQRELTLEKAQNLAEAAEMAEKGGVELNTNTNNAVNVMRSFTKKTDEQQNKTNQEKFMQRKCYRCGSTTHLSHQCRHKETICNFCNIKGHLRRACMKERKAVHTMTTNHDDNDQLHEMEDSYDSVELINSVRDRYVGSKMFYTLLVNNQWLKFEIDTGAAVTVVGLTDVEKVLGKVKIYKADTKLYNYCNQQVDCIGYTLVRVTAGGCSTLLKLYVVRGNRSGLLGRDWLRKIKLNWAQIIQQQLSLNKVDEVTLNTGIEKQMQYIVSKYPMLCSSSIGKITGFQARLHVREEAVPQFFKARRVPFALTDSLEKELQQQVDDGILVKVNYSEWATPIVAVKKKNNTVRICGDYKVTLNPALRVDEHPLPTIDELFATMAGGKKFTKIDLSRAYLQLEVHPEDRKYLTLNTHKGLYQPTRMMFGIASAPAIWQRFMEQLLAGIPGVTVFLDDIKITADTDEDHLHRIDQVFQRLNEHNMRVNLGKSNFMKPSIEYCGFLINKDGIHKIKSKVKAIQELKTPNNKDEVRALVGLVNYYGRFFRNLSMVLYPINRLLQKNVEFVWSTECEESLQEVKKQMQSNIILTHFDPKLPVVLAVDASPYGVGAVLSHQMQDGTERPIQFASQTLSKVQQKYSQIDKEALAIVFGVRRFYQYLYGRKFILVTDNKPVSQIFSPKKGLPLLSTSRMQHYAIFLQSFDFDIRVKKSKDNGNADAMSRLTDVNSENEADDLNAIDINLADDYINAVELSIIENLPVTVAELSEVTEADEETKVLRNSLKVGRECDRQHRFNIVQTEFGLQQGCLLRGIRVYIPRKLRPRVLKELHAAHFGMTKMKTLARAYCWWPSLDRDIEHLVSNCVDCQSVRPSASKVMPSHVWNPPLKVFERVHADFAGPFKGEYLFILVDAFSKWPEVHIIPDITAKSTIKICRDIFASFGLPNIFVTDHGTQFKSEEFQCFLRSNGIIHKMGAPYHPATNGQAERFVQTIKNKLNTVNCKPSEMKREIANILLAYRRAIHPVTEKSPSHLMFGRQIRTRLDLMLPIEEPNVVCLQEPSRNFSVGDRVAARDYMTKDKWKFGSVVNMFGKLHYEIKLDDGRLWKRHVDQMRRIGNNIGTNLSSRTTSVSMQAATTTPTSKNTSTQISAETTMSIPMQVPTNTSTTVISPTQTPVRSAVVADVPVKDSQSPSNQMRDPTDSTSPVVTNLLPEPPNNTGTPTSSSKETQSTGPMRQSTRLRKEPERMKDYLKH